MWQAHARAVESVNAARAREECDAAAHWRYQECRGNRRGVQCMEWSGKLVLVRVCEMCLVIKCSAWRKFEGAGCDAVLSVRCGALLPAIVCYIVVGAQRLEASGRARCRLHVCSVAAQLSPAPAVAGGGALYVRATPSCAALSRSSSSRAR